MQTASAAALPAHSTAALPASAHAGALPPSSDLEARILGSGCSAAFYALEECLGEHARCFSACQPHVQAWKACNAATAAATASSAPATPAKPQ